MKMEPPKPGKWPKWLRDQFDDDFNGSDLLSIGTPDDTAEYIPERKPMAEPIQPVDPWVLRINALADAIKGLVTPVLALVAAVSGIYGGVHSQYASTQTNANAAKIDAVASQVNESAKMLSRPPVFGAVPEKK